MHMWMNETAPQTLNANNNALKHFELIDQEPGRE